MRLFWQNMPWCGICHWSVGAAEEQVLENMGSSWVQKLCHLHSWWWWYPSNSPRRETNHDFVLAFVDTHRKQEQISWESLQRQHQKYGCSSWSPQPQRWCSAGLREDVLWCFNVLSALQSPQFPSSVLLLGVSGQVPQPGLFAQLLCWPSGVCTDCLSSTGTAGRVLHRALELHAARIWEARVPRNPGQMYKILAVCQNNISRWRRTCLRNANMWRTLPNGFHGIPRIIQCFSQKRNGRQGTRPSSSKLFFFPLLIFLQGLQEVEV